MLSNIYKQFINYPLTLAIDERKDSKSFSHIERSLSILISYLKQPRPLIVIEHNLYTAEELYNRLASFTDEVEIFMAEESLRLESIASSPEYLANRLAIMDRLVKKENFILILHSASVLRKLPNPKTFIDYSLEIKRKDRFEMRELQEKLIKAGYEMTARVDQPLTFSVRGGVVDVYSINHEQPIRIEFFDDEIDTIRYFDIKSQKTKKLLDEITIIPATDILFDDAEKTLIFNKMDDYYEKSSNHPFKDEIKKHHDQDKTYLKESIPSQKLYQYYSLLNEQYSILDYNQQAQCIMINKDKFEQQAKKLSLETAAYIKETYDLGQSYLITDLYHSSNKVYNREIQDIDNKEIQNQIKSLIHPIDVPVAEFDYVINDIIDKSKTNKIVLVIEDYEFKIVIESLMRRQTPYQIYDSNKELQKGIYLSKGSLYQGFYYENIYVYSSKELFNNKIRQTKYSKKFKEAEYIDEITELNKGDYVVHNNYGVGQYVGIITREIKGIQRDFLKIIYRNDDELLVPLQQFNLVRKFVSREGAAPRLNKLGSNEWEKTKERLSKNVDDLAERLVELYSLRSTNEGFAFKKDQELEEEFASKIDFKLTDDQAKAIAEIEEDMMKAKPMDRLLSGDVGFGKTEVSMRAAFKAVYNGKQVAFLCPTTILSEQHFETFKTRFYDFPVKIAVINRFASLKQQKEILEQLKQGEIDILIGTHRLLSKDVIFKDLGLLIIDEEQRFGVEHKEKIKEIKVHVDVLSLSATPIPRTMQMSLVGIRSLSQLTQAPKNRQPIQTYLIERNKETVFEVIQREVAREGQVYYLHNNVENLSAIAFQIQREFPTLKVGIVHGQMNKEDIENVMIEFTLKEYDVLVCTTIIETGIDISNANTIIIDQADTFGLSQLYQIRGRVGRGDRIAYCYLMVSPEKQLTEIAEKRLDTIKEFTQLGSGYKIAMRDLTIRGAGDMLGPEQSGFIDTVGIDMYLEMLNQAIKKQTGETVEEQVQEPAIRVETKGHIPEDFTHYDIDKIKLYQEVDAISNLSSLQELYKDTSDLYGKLPKDVDLIFESKHLELLLNDPTIESYKENEHWVILTFNEGFSQIIDGIALFKQVSDLNHEIKVNYTNNKINIKIPKNKNWINDIIEILSNIVTKGD